MSTSKLWTQDAGKNNVIITIAIDLPHSINCIILSKLKGLVSSSPNRGTSWNMDDDWITTGTGNSDWSRVIRCHSDGILHPWGGCCVTQILLGWCVILGCLGSEVQESSCENVIWPLDQQSTPSFSYSLPLHNNISSFVMNVNLVRKQWGESIWIIF